MRRATDGRVVCTERQVFRRCISTCAPKIIKDNSGLPSLLSSCAVVLATVKKVRTK